DGASELHENYRGFPEKENGRVRPGGDAMAGATKHGNKTHREHQQLHQHSDAHALRQSDSRNCRSGRIGISGAFGPLLEQDSTNRKLGIPHKLTVVGSQ
ncbi:unnamed protein product, partial [Ectocarpus fasciculatus]